MIGAGLPGTANERTHLAWNRTALTWVAVGLIVARYHGPDGLASKGALAGIALGAAGFGLWLAGAIRYRQRREARRAGLPMPESANLLAAVTIVVTLVIGLVILLESARLAVLS